MRHEENFRGVQRHTPGNVWQSAAAGNVLTGWVREHRQLWGTAKQGRALKPPWAGRGPRAALAAGAGGQCHCPLTCGEIPATAHPEQAGSATAESKGQTPPQGLPMYGRAGAGSETWGGPEAPSCQGAAAGQSILGTTQVLCSCSCFLRSTLTHFYQK